MSEKIKVTIDIFSGRENPVIEFTGKQLQELKERLEPIGKVDLQSISAPLSTLGYRGLIIEQDGQIIPELPKKFRLLQGHSLTNSIAYMAKDDCIEDFICESASEKFPLDELHRFKELTDFRNIWDWDCIRYPWMPRCRGGFEIPPIKQVKCKCGPVYEPQWWNVPTIQPFNNCYNYATNLRTNTFAQPGQAAGAKYPSPIDCTGVKNGAIADKLENYDLDDMKCPKEGHLVALVVAPGWDYHWYRKGRDGYWTHKPGRTPVTNVDDNQALITDPRTANRGMYTEFCGFMIVKHGHIMIGRKP